MAVFKLEVNFEEIGKKAKKIMRENNVSYGDVVRIITEESQRKVLNLINDKINKKIDDWLKTNRFEKYLNDQINNFVKTVTELNFRELIRDELIKKFNGLLHDVEDPILDQDITELQMTIRSENCCRNIKANTIRELTLKTSKELLTTKNLGIRSLKEIKNALKERGLSLREA